MYSLKWFLSKHSTRHNFQKLFEEGTVSVRESNTEPLQICLETKGDNDEDRFSTAAKDLQISSGNGSLPVMTCA